MSCFEARPPPELSGHSDSIFALAVSPDGLFLYSGSYDATIVVWSLSRDEHASSIPERLAVLRGHTDKINALAVASKTPGFLASASDDSTVSLWNMATEMPASGHRRPTYALRLTISLAWLSMTWKANRPGGKGSDACHQAAAESLIC